jgi:hypothetical protein
MKKLYENTSCGTLFAIFNMLQINQTLFKTISIKQNLLAICYFSNLQN